jgi:hypothetical protein
MNKIVEYEIPCPNCKQLSKHDIFHSVNNLSKNTVKRILCDEINFVVCTKCKNKFHVKTGILFCNHEKLFAVYYHPSDINTIDFEMSELKKVLGELHYLNKIIKFSNWEKFKKKIYELEYPSKLTVRTVSNRSDFMPYYDNFWTCDICDGDSTSGCLYFDPTECPRHT